MPGKILAKRAVTPRSPRFNVGCNFVVGKRLCKNGSFLIPAGGTLCTTLATLEAGVTGDFSLAPYFLWPGNVLDSGSCAVLFLSRHGIDRGSDFPRPAHHDLAHALCTAPQHAHGLCSLMTADMHAHTKSRTTVQLLPESSVG